MQWRFMIPPPSSSGYLGSLYLLVSLAQLVLEFSSSIFQMLYIPESLVALQLLHHFRQIELQHNATAHEDRVNDRAIPARYGHAAGRFCGNIQFKTRQVPQLP